MATSLQAVILAAGRGTRMKSGRAKVLHELFDRPLLDYSLEGVRSLRVNRPLVVVGWGKDEVRDYLNGRADTVVQSPQLGTGHAVGVTKSKLASFRGDLLIWPADMTLIREETLRHFVAEHRALRSKATVLSALAVNPTGYGRILRRGGRVVGIVEELDASAEEKRIQEVNTGIYLFEPVSLFRTLEKIRPANRKKEYYLTDVIRLMDKAGGRVEALPFALSEEAHGINSQEDLARAVKILNQRTIQKLQMEGVTIVAPEQTFIAPDVRAGKDTVIYPWTYIERGVRIGRGCRIGPFAKIRSGSTLEDGAVIGSFVEINRSRIGKKVLAKHLTYLGDAVVGAGTNIGAGTITANFDGKKKNKTRIGKKAFIGAGTVLIAPVQLGNGARTGAGAVLTRGTKVGAGKIFVGVPARPLNRKGRKTRSR